MKRTSILFVLTVAAMLWCMNGAEARCSGPQGVPFNCDAGTAIQPDDLFLGGQGGDTKKFTGTQLVDFLGSYTAQGTPVDRSGTITLGGATQILMNVNANRVGCELQPLGMSSIWINVTGAASSGAGSVEVTPGSVYTCPHPVPTTAINIYSLSTGVPFTATEYSR